jgi:chromosome segregation ATPase
MLSIQLNLLEFVVLFVSAAILGGAIKFFVASNKALKKTIEEENTSFAGNLFIRKKQSLTEPVIDEDDFQPEFLTAKKEEGGVVSEKEVRKLKEQLMQQQKSMDALIEKFDELDLAAVNKSLKEENEELKEKLGAIEEELDQKESELQHIRQKEAVAQKMAVRLEDVYKEFEYLQNKIAELESNSNNVAHVELSLTELKESYEGAKKELQRKQDKLDEVLTENQQLHYQLSEVEDKLAEANMQRQQLLKKVQYLTEMGNEMQGISDTNKKLQNELRRISELESMLNMMIEEREQTQRKKGTGL